MTQNSASSTPPTIIINGDNPAIITIGDTYANLGATVSDTGQGQAGDTNLGLKYFLNGMLVSNIVFDTSAIASDTIDYVATDIVMIRCPETRQAVSTGIRVDRATFRSMPVFFSRFLCPLCGKNHEWFAKDAWVCDSGTADCDPNCEREVA